MDTVQREQHLNKSNQTPHWSPLSTNGMAAGNSRWCVETNTFINYCYEETHKDMHVARAGGD